jgi:hypothetical protein
MEKTINTEWGIRIVRGKIVEYIPFGEKSDAISAKEAWDIEEPSSQPSLVHREVIYTEWEL